MEQVVHFIAAIGAAILVFAIGAVCVRLEKQPRTRAEQYERDAANRDMAMW
jgi:hypothetical protein